MFGGYGGLNNSGGWSQDVHRVALALDASLSKPMKNRSCFTGDLLQWDDADGDKKPAAAWWACMSEEEMLTEARSCAFPGGENFPGPHEGTTSVPNEALREMAQAMTSLHQELAAVKAEAAQRRSEVAAVKAEAEQRRSEVEQLKADLALKRDEVEVLSTTSAGSSASSSTEASEAQTVVV
jgi:hypothetical protein